MSATFRLVLVLIVLTSCSNNGKETPIDLTELTIGEINDGYVYGEFTAAQLTQAYLDRIAALDEDLNAITFINPDALNRAEELDDEFRRTGVLRPLHGIPIIVKDNINTVGLPTTAGSKALQDFVPDQDAPIIQKLKEAGAIIIAKSNMAEWAFSPMHSESSTHGTTRNPYNLDRVPAGSSGGTAAAVAANFGTVGLGTDTGNSIRGPSSHCALVGFRTTLGLISRTGIVPLYLRNDVVGPMCRTVEDATKVMEVMVGVDPADSITYYSEGKKHEDYEQFLKGNDAQGKRIGVLRTLSDRDVDPDIKNLFEQALIDLSVIGAEIIDSFEVPGFDNLRQGQWCSTFRKDVEAFLSTYVKSDTLQTLEDIIRVGTNSAFARDRLQGNANSGSQQGNPCADAYTDQKRIAFREAIEQAMDSLRLDAIVYPSWNNKPARIDQFHEEYRGDNSQVIAPHTGQPAFTVPMGYTEGNLPAGIQFLGRMYAEPILIQLAYAYEQHTQHRKPPGLE